MSKKIRNNKFILTIKGIRLSEAKGINLEDKFLVGFNKETKFDNKLSIRMSDIGNFSEARPTVIWKVEPERNPTNLKLKAIWGAEKRSSYISSVSLYEDSGLRAKWFFISKREAKFLAKRWRLNKYVM